MIPDAGARFIPVTSEHATEQADRERLARENRERRFRQSRGLPEPAPIAQPKPRRKVVVKTIPAPQPVVGSSPIGAGAPKAGRGVGPAPTTPPGADEVRMSRREFEAVSKLIRQQPWSKSGNRRTVGQPKRN